MAAQKRNEMTPDEINELLTLKDWSQGDLARALETEPSTVSRWINGGTPAGPARIILKAWLEQARNDAKAVKEKKKIAAR